MNKELIRALTEYVISNRKDDEMNIVEVCCLIDEWFGREGKVYELDGGVNWDDAPTGATRGTNSTRWWNEKGEYIATTNSVSFERPAPSAPKVEAGQVWVHKESGREYIIDEIIVFDGKTKIGDWQDDFTLVVYNPSAVKLGMKSGDIYRRTLPDFVAKFEQVQS
jgi:hypothetical protein